MQAGWGGEDLNTHTSLKLSFSPTAYLGCVCVCARACVNTCQCYFVADKRPVKINLLNLSVSMHAGVVYYNL